MTDQIYFHYYVSLDCISVVILVQDIANFNWQYCTKYVDNILFRAKIIGMSRKNCVYCNKEITDRSREHVIHNALGGLYESTDVCCPECNNYVSRYIDAPFTKIFNPIIGRIQNFSKTNKTALPPCSGIIEYNGKKYNDAIIKGDKVVGCASLSQELRSDISKLTLPIVGYNFNVTNKEFEMGMSKIAFNYALDKGMDLDLLKHGLKVQSSPIGVSGIEVSYPLIPFCPMNTVDSYLELETPMELYHHMILFNQGQTLWCYIDLFNTFQYYVLLTDKLPKGTRIFDDYVQTVQKLDRTMPDLSGVYRPKDIMIYAQQYKVEPCMDMTEFARRIQNAISTKSQKSTLQKVIGPKTINMAIPCFMECRDDAELMRMMTHSVNLYMDEHDQLRTEAFRTVTPATDGTLLSYPYTINATCGQDQTALKMYTTAKFNRLNTYLCQQKTK